MLIRGVFDWRLIDKHYNILIEKACDDTPSWTNNAGENCGYYDSNVCHNGSAISKMENMYEYIITHLKLLLMFSETTSLSLAAKQFMYA